MTLEYKFVPGNSEYLSGNSAHSRDLEHFCHIPFMSLMLPTLLCRYHSEVLESTLKMNHTVFRCDSKLSLSFTKQPIHQLSIRETFTGSFSHCSRPGARDRWVSEVMVLIWDLPTTIMRPRVQKSRGTGVPGPAEGWLGRESHRGDAWMSPGGWEGSSLEKSDGEREG
jgi:hypothetical protein